MHGCQCRRGFTLVEMLAATVAAAILLGGVLSLVALLGRDRQRLAAEAARPPLDSVVELMRTDLASSTQYLQDPKGQSLVLVGCGGMDTVSGRRDGRPVYITYRAVETAAGPCLVRQQVYCDETAESPAKTQLVMVGVGRLRLRPVDSTRAMALAPVRVAATRPAPLASRVQLELYATEAEANPLVQVLLVLR